MILTGQQNDPLGKHALLSAQVYQFRVVSGFKKSGYQGEKYEDKKSDDPDDNKKQSSIHPAHQPGVAVFSVIHIIHCHK